MRELLLAVIFGVSIQAQMLLPPLLSVNTNNACQELAMNSASTRYGANIITTASAISGAIIRVGTVTTGGDVAVRLYGVDSSGYPAGTPIDLATFTVSAGSTWYTVTWTPQSITLGTLYALMFEFASYSGQNFTFAGCGSDNKQASMYYNGTAWSSPGYSSLWVLDGSGNPLPETAFLPIYRSNYQLSSSSTPDERGIACVFDSAYRVFAVRYHATNIRTGAYTIEVYESGTNIRSVSGSVASSTYAFSAIPVDFVIKPGVEYIVSFKPSTTTGAGFLWWDLTSFWNFSSAYRDIRKLFGRSSCQTVYRTDGGAWTYDNSVYHGISLIAVPAGR